MRTTLKFPSSSSILRPMEWDHIERIRRTKFSVGAAHNPLAAELHKAIKQLSVELYQNDVHFIKEIIQNAEDNKYSDGISPSLEFLLTKKDVAEVGASATLIAFNNEDGLSTFDVEALCSVACSTKTGKRREGFIGSKGIGFKSVFTVSETAIIISNGYRIRFRAEASKEAGMGYIVPEWTKIPTNEAIKSCFGRAELPMTVIILPISDGKVDLVRKQLRELSPEIILFLSRIQELKVVDKTKDAPHSGELMKITRSSRVPGIRSTKDSCNFFRVSLHVESSKVSQTYSYCIFQQSVPVTHPVEERQEIEEWAITLAFPHHGRPSASNIGDVFSFLPTELRTGFPFIVNADFILTSSRETIRFDSEWNVGILNCIPAAFHLAFKIMLRREKSLQADGVTLTSKLLLDDSKDAYKYLPCNNIENVYKFSSATSDDHRNVRQKIGIQPLPPHQAGNLHQLEKVRRDIILGLSSSEDLLIILSTHTIGNVSTAVPLFFSTKLSLQIKSSFRAILETAAKCNHPAPSVVWRFSDGTLNPSRKFGIVDGYIQQNYAAGLSSIGVPHMTAADYKSFLMDSTWLLALPDDLYFQVLTFFAFELNILNKSDIDHSTMRKTYRLLKFRGENDTVELATFDEVSMGIEYFYTSDAEGAEWISKWVKEFNPWHPSKVMPKSTSEALRNADNSEELMRWLSKHGSNSLTELNVQNYSRKLMDRLMVANGDSQTHAILVMQFLYCATQEKLLSWKETIIKLQKLENFNVIDHKRNSPRIAAFKFRQDGGILLPRTVSKWPLLLDISRGSGRSGQRLIALSNLYLDPQCDLAKDIVTDSPGSGSMIEFIRESMNAVDLPSIKIPTNEPFPFRHPMTMKKSVLLFEWLKVQLPNRRRTRKEIDNDVLLTSLQNLRWMQTIHHGWQLSTSVFFSASDFSSHFMSHDLPFFDSQAYGGALDLTDSETAYVLGELEVVTDVTNGCAAVADFLSTLPANELDQAEVTRFYMYLHKFQWQPQEPQHDTVKIWIPATGKSKLKLKGPFWRAKDECIIRDENDIFVDSNNLSVIDKFYDTSLLPFFAGALSVPETAPIDHYLKIWLKWCKNVETMTQDDSHMQQTMGINQVKVCTVWSNILLKWQDRSKNVWDSFVSKAWVPVHPKSQELLTETLSIVPPYEVFIVDDLRMSKSFNTIASGKMNSVYELPGMSNGELKSLMELYSAMGVKKLSEVVKNDISIPAGVWTKEVPRGEGLICEGLFRSVLAYLCQNEPDLTCKERQKLLSPLMSAVEVVVLSPFMNRCTLETETCTSPAAIVTKNVLAYYDRLKGKLFYLAKDHELLKTEVAKRDFNTQLATTISRGILFERPELSPGLTTLLKLLCNSSFAMDSVEYELQEQNLVIFCEDEVALGVRMAIRQQKPVLRIL